MTMSQQEMTKRLFLLKRQIANLEEILAHLKQQWVQLNEDFQNAEEPRKQ